MGNGERYDGDTPPLADIMRQIADNQIRQGYNNLPAQIVFYDPVRQCADVSPVVIQQDVGGVPVPFPILPCCPVQWPSGGGFSIVFPLFPGDICTVKFTTLSMAQWWISGNPLALPESSRRGSLSDGIVQPGLRPVTLPLLAPILGALAVGKDDGTAGLVVDLAGNVQVNAVAGIVSVLATLHQVGAGLFSVAAAELIFAELLKIQVAIAGVGGVYTPPLSAAAIATALSRSD